jgi:RimJ/RimL family protein N-acetyltransferase
MRASLQLVSVVFETERLRAVPWRADHAETAHAAYSQPDFVRYLGNSQPHPDLEHTRRWIARINELNTGKRDGFWAVELRSTGELVGATLCHPVPGGDGEHEIGWHVFPPHQSHGYATEVGRGAAAYGFEVLGLDELIAVVMPANVASLAVARAIGMRSSGRTSRYYEVEVELFTLSREKFAAAARAAPRR